MRSRHRRVCCWRCHRRRCHHRLRLCLNALRGGCLQLHLQLRPRLRLHVDRRATQLGITLLPRARAQHHALVSLLLHRCRYSGGRRDRRYGRWWGERCGGRCGGWRGGRRGGTRPPPAKEAVDVRLGRRIPAPGLRVPLGALPLSVVLLRVGHVQVAPPWRPGGCRGGGRVAAGRGAAWDGGRVGAALRRAVGGLGGRVHLPRGVTELTGRQGYLRCTRSGWALTALLSYRVGVGGDGEYACCHLAVRLLVRLYIDLVEHGRAVLAQHVGLETLARQVVAWGATIHGTCGTQPHTYRACPPRARLPSAFKYNFTAHRRLVRVPHKGGPGSYTLSAEVAADAAPHARVRRQRVVPRGVEWQDVRDAGALLARQLGWLALLVRILHHQLGPVYTRSKQRDTPRRLTPGWPRPPRAQGRRRLEPGGCQDNAFDNVTHRPRGRSASTTT
eukprot:scaffold48167_cov68-Phaeocystis_antarctica.AAC.4